MKHIPRTLFAMGALARAATSPEVRHTFAMTIAVDDALVERPAPGAAPTAFRIWKAGENMSDEGPIEFTEKSAELLLREQAARARRYASDFDHLSLTTDRPAEAGRASGWHSLEVRRDAEGRAELWAVEIEWCADAKAGLEETPPRWRFFSPAFRTKGGEVTSYLNFALCINPLTHGLPSLASSTANEGQKTMTKKEAAALWAKICADQATDEEKRAFAAFFDGEDKDEKKDAEDGAEEKKKDDEDEKKSADEGEEKKDEKEEQKAHAAKKPAATDDAGRAMATELAEAKARLAAIEVERMLDTRPDLFGTEDKPTSIRKWAKTQEPENLKTYIASAPKKMAAREEKPTVGAGAGTAKASGLQGRELEEVNRAMGVRPREMQTPRVLEDGRFVIPTVKPSEWRAHAAKNAKTDAVTSGKEKV